MLNIDCRAEVWIGGAGVKRFLGEAKLLVRPPSSWHVVTSLAPHHHQLFAPRNMEFSFCVLLYETSVSLQSIGWEQWWKICKTTVHWLGMAMNGMREDFRACPMFFNRHKRERFPTVFFYLSLVRWKIVERRTDHKEAKCTLGCYDAYVITFLFVLICRSSTWGLLLLSVILWSGVSSTICAALGFLLSSLLWITLIMEFCFCVCEAISRLLSIVYTIFLHFKLS